MVSVSNSDMFFLCSPNSGERKRTLSSELSALSVLLVKKDKSMELVGNFHGEKTVNTRY